MGLPLLVILAVSAAPLVADDVAVPPIFGASYRIAVPPMRPRWTAEVPPDLVVGADAGPSAGSPWVPETMASRAMAWWEPSPLLEDLMYHPQLARVPLLPADIRWEGLMQPLYERAFGPGSQIPIGGPRHDALERPHPRVPHAHAHEPNLRPLERLLHFDVKF